MLEFSTKKLQIKFNETLYEIGYPTVADLKDYTEKLDEKKETEIQLVLDLLDNLGLPKKVSGKMEMDHLNVIIEELIQTKK